MTNEMFLRLESAPASEADLSVAQDLLDTIRAHKNECVGMAANMIGVGKRIIVFDDGNDYTVMFNPELTKGYGVYETSEGCLSLQGVRPTKRFKKITVKYQGQDFSWHSKSYSGWTAQIIQHEIDHCNGIII